MFTDNSFGVPAIETAVLSLQLLRSFLFLPPAILMDLVLFRLSSVSTTTASKYLQGLPKILLVLNRGRNAYSISDLAELFDVVFEVVS